MGKRIHRNPTGSVGGRVRPKVGTAVSDGRAEGADEDHAQVQGTVEGNAQGRLRFNVAQAGGHQTADPNAHDGLGDAPRGTRQEDGVPGGPGARGGGENGRTVRPRQPRQYVLSQQRRAVPARHPAPPRWSQELRAHEQRRRQPAADAGARPPVKIPPLHVRDPRQISVGDLAPESRHGDQDGVSPDGTDGSAGTADAAGRGGIFLQYNGSGGDAAAGG
mmetsp:Transcript_26149/g.62786  ORF Transcript_26149/g.62786 Transcript_26149/m.62786 type:complete len:219 (-) Transcript_26149:1287-1943(-)